LKSSPAFGTLNIVQKRGRKTSHSGRRRDSSSRKGRSQTVVTVEWLGLVALILIFIGLLLFDPPHSTGNQVQGTLVGGDQTSSPLGSPGRYTVRLSNGQEIDIPIARTEGSHKKRDVMLEEYETYIFKRKTYSFLRFIDQNQDRGQSGR
jgi:hypothetical protein